MSKNIVIITITAIVLIVLGGAAAYIGLRQVPGQEGTGQDNGDGPRISRISWILGRDVL
jgi:hypothetical protein